MQIIFKKQDNPNFDYLPTFAKDFALWWLRMNGIWPDAVHFRVNYNSVYHHYEMILYPDNRETIIMMENKIKQLCDKEGHNLNLVAHWHRWERNDSDNKPVEVEGIRIWIEAV